jgi:hypothetical protein
LKIKSYSTWLCLPFEFPLIFVDKFSPARNTVTTTLLKTTLHFFRASNRRTHRSRRRPFPYASSFPRRFVAVAPRLHRRRIAVSSLDLRAAVLDLVAAAAYSTEAGSGDPVCT